MVTDVPGIAVGHWTDERSRTGCTAVVLPPGTVASGEVRGGAPGTREWDLLAPERRVGQVDVVVLAGGSAFGLAACDGAMRWCEEQGRGVATGAGPVPIVVGAVIFDLSAGDAVARPGASAGYQACAAARAGPVELGRVGAGAGAAFGRWRSMTEGAGGAIPAGVTGSTLRDGDLVVSALVVVNAFGEPRATRDGDALTGGVAGGATGGAGVTAGPSWPPPDSHGTPAPRREATTIGVIATNASLDKLGCLLVAQSGHDGLARALEPVHTTFDGDALVAVSTCSVAAHLEQVRYLAARAVEAAVASLT